MKLIKSLAFLFALFLADNLLAIESDAYKYSQFNSTTTVSIIPVKLHSISVTAPLPVAFTVYDSTASTVTSPIIAVFSTSTVGGTYIFDVQTQNGLQVNEAASGSQVTVSFR